MKKLAMSAVAAALLSTSALAEVTISGTTEFYYKSDDSQITANDGTSMGNSDNEIKFTFSNKTDTGLEYGYVVELTTVGDSSSTVDESSLYISGSMGKIILGGNDAVTDNFGIGEQDIMSEEVGGTYTNATIQSNAGEKTYGADLTKASYISPVVGGFQAGASYYDSGAAGTTDSTSFGASYAVNTDTTIAVSTMNSEDALDVSGTEKEELTQHMLEVKRNIAPGLNVFVNYTDYDYNNGGESSTDDDGSVVQFKVAASF
tara:strand:- start:69 stop:848 length:780 start_codon:yes stop_codon:yes gene_type:complete